MFGCQKASVQFARRRIKFMEMKRRLESMIKLKLMEDGKSIMMDEDGLPIAIDDEKPEGEQEFAIDAIHLLGKIPSLQNEAKTHREAKTDVETKLKAFEGIEDAKAALDALEKVKTWGDKELLDTKKVDKMKEQILAVEKEKYDAMDKNYKTQLSEKDVLLESQRADIFDSMVSQRFLNSGWFSGAKPKSVMLPEVAKAYFGPSFKVEKIEGVNRVIGYDSKNEKIFSRKRSGEYAEFDECIETIINQHQDKDSFLQPSTGSKSPGGGKAFSNSENKKLVEMAPGERLAAIRRTKNAE